ncbi:MAG: hypothetical protein AB7E27_04785 [Candidatus Methanomethylophilaceae archaeon]|jgi:hypothetical protein
MDELEIRVTAGWRYLVHSQGEGEKGLDSIGSFLGYTSLGQDTAMVMDIEAQDGTSRQRIIPTASILYVELLERRPLTDVEKKDEVYFG